MNDEEHPERGGVMLFLDMETALDRVSYEFLMNAVQAVGFGPSFLKTLPLGIMYNTVRPPKRRVYANGFYSDWFEIKSGVAQGCPLSPLLFKIGLELRTQEPEYRGITIGDRRIEASPFADDSTLFLAGPQDMPHAEKGLQKWCRASGMRENLKKREGFIAMGKYNRGRAAPQDAASGDRV
ncbi:reverse transcriptase domain-containing protein, partial [bacterium]|nr:reverse transcriptase domain-containing protein [bacterium]